MLSKPGAWPTVILWKRQICRASLSNLLGFFSLSAKNQFSLLGSSKFPRKPQRCYRFIGLYRLMFPIGLSIPNWGGLICIYDKRIHFQYWLIIIISLSFPIPEGGGGGRAHLLGLLKLGVFINLHFFVKEKKIWSRGDTISGVSAWKLKHSYTPPFVSVLKHPCLD